MQQIAITKMDDGLIVAEFVRYNGNFCLVAYHMSKTIPREEALGIKNKYGMKAIPTGYRGEVPRSVFIGGKLIV